MTESGHVPDVLGSIPPPPEALSRPNAHERWRFDWSWWVVLGVALAATGLSPTGGRLTDPVMVTAIGALAGRATRRTPTWLSITALGVMIAYSLGDWTFVALASVLLAAGAALELTGRTTPTIASVLAALSLFACACLPSHGRFGTSAAVGLAVALVLVVAGLRQEDHLVRRRYRYGVIFGLELAAIFTGLALYKLVRVRDDLGRIKDEVRAAVDSFSIDDPDAARTTLEAAAASVEEVGDRIDSVLLRGAEFVPVVAQHVRAARVLATQTGPALESVADATDVLRPDRLSIRDGKVDLGVLSEMSGTVDDLASRVGGLRHAVDNATTGWLIAKIRDPLEELQPDLHHADDLAAGVSRLLDRAPVLLGDETPRRYFVALLTPAEARGLGGFMGNYAILSAKDGGLELSDFGRYTDLLDAATSTGKTLSLSTPRSYLDRYERYGVGGDGKTTPPWWWQQITVSPDMPEASEAIADLYRQSTGEEIDGVITLDPTAIEALVSATGPVDPGGGAPEVDVDNIREFITRGQYQQFANQENAERRDALQTIARTTIDRLLDRGELPQETLRRLGDAVAGRHLMIWLADAKDQHAIERAGASGRFELEREPSTQSIAVINQNGGPNKLDAYLQRTITYRGVLGDDGVLRADVTVELANEVPSLDLRAEVLDNLKGDPFGTNRTVVSLYSSGSITDATADPTSSALGRGHDLGWTFVERLARVAPFGSTVLDYRVEQRIADPAALTLELVAQPVANPDLYVVKVTTEDGRVLIDSATTLRRTTRLTLEAASA